MTAFLTHVELTWREKRIEHWIRFGHPAHNQRLDRHRRRASFAPGSVFAFVRWAANDFGMIISRIDIVRTVDHGDAYQTKRSRSRYHSSGAAPLRLCMESELRERL